MPSRHDYHEDMATGLGALIQQNLDGIRRLQLIGNVSAPLLPSAIYGLGDLAPNQELILARYPYNPAYHVWTQMTVYVEITPSDADLAVLAYYTLDDAASWTAIPLNSNGDAVCGDYWEGSFAVDLTGILGPTWIGARIVVVPDPLTPGATNICRSHVYLERPGY